MCAPCYKINLDCRKSYFVSDKIMSPKKFCPTY